MPSRFKIRDREIGGRPVYLIAEAGSNHNGDLKVARELIAAAAEAGADAVKFQAFRASRHYSRHTPSFTYLDAQGNQLSTYDLIASLEIDRAWHAPLIDYARSKGIDFLSSPCDSEAVDQLAELGMPAFKLASFDLPDVRLIRHMARHGRPLILSTGMANYTDIETAIGAARSVGNEQVVLLQCTSLYPAPVDLSNLAAIETLRRAFDLPVGYSDHTLGDHVSLAAVALGACMIEKHVTLDRKLPGPDHSFAIEPGELAAMVRKIRDVEAAIGDGIKCGPRPAEREMFEKGRRSVHVVRDLKAGDVIGADDLVIKRPGFGISPALADHLVGRTLGKPVAADHWITWDDLR